MADKNQDSFDVLAPLLLETLSLYESYTLERLIIELDKNFVEFHSSLTVDDLELVLKKLCRQKKVKQTKGPDGDKRYQRLFPRKTLRQKWLIWWEGLK